MRSYVIVLVAILHSLVFSELQLSAETRPTNSMTRIQEVFRTLMAGNRPMMLVSRGKKSGDALVNEERHPFLLVPTEALRRRPARYIDEMIEHQNDAISEAGVDPVELQQQPRLGTVVWMLSQQKQSGEN